MNGELTIRLDYDHGEPEQQPGSYTASAYKDDSPEYDASGATPLEAMWNLARTLYDECSSHEPW